MKNRALSSRRRAGFGRPRAGAFTIVEILVVVMIIGVLVTLIVPRYFGRVGQAKKATAEQKVATIDSAILMFQNDYGRFPQSLDELISRPVDIPEEKWNYPSLRPKDLKDPWGREFLYKQPGDNGPYDLVCLGADGKLGGEGNDADINNWD